MRRALMSANWRGCEGGFRIEFRLGAQARGTTTTIGRFALSGLSGSHSHLARIHLSNKRVVD
jgi:hypothetical protein